MRRGVVRCERKTDLDNGAGYLGRHARKIAPLRPTRVGHRTVGLVYQRGRVSEIARVAEQLEPLAAGVIEEAIEHNRRVQDFLLQPRDIGPAGGELVNDREGGGVVCFDAPGQRVEHGLSLIPKLPELPIDGARSSARVSMRPHV